MLQAYAACSLANIAFLPEGQKRICDCAGAVANMMQRMEALKKREPVRAATQWPRCACA